MKSKNNKKLLFEMMHKVGGMPLKEDVKTQNIKISKTNVNDVFKVQYNGIVDGSVINITGTLTPIDLNGKLFYDFKPDEMNDYNTKTNYGLNSDKIDSEIITHLNQKGISENPNISNNFNEWKNELIKIIMTDSGLSINEISINDNEIMNYFNQGKSPEEVYNNIWLKDAGNFYNVSDFGQ